MLDKFVTLDNLATFKVNLDNNIQLFSLNNNSSGTLSSEVLAKVNANPKSCAFFKMDDSVQALGVALYAGSSSNYAIYEFTHNSESSIVRGRISIVRTTGPWGNAGNWEYTKTVYQNIDLITLLNASGTLDDSQKAQLNNDYDRVQLFYNNIYYKLVRASGSYVYYIGWSGLQGTLPSQCSINLNTGRYSFSDITNPYSTTISTGELLYVSYDAIKNYKFIVLYGYKHNIDTPNQTAFVIIPDQLEDPKYIDGVLTDVENFEVYAVAGGSNWTYPIKVKKSQDGNVYWWSAYDYSGDDLFYVNKIVGVK